VVTAVLTLKKELWIVYFGVKGERMRYCVVDGTVVVSSTDAPRIRDKPIITWIKAEEMEREE